MPEIAIHIENLGKKYRLGKSARKGENVKEMIASLPSRLFRRKGPEARGEEFWALKDINLDIEKGDVVGIIGPNGAGKSTLLKVLSRITYPTTGSALVKGRIGSLLEVGTGFHPELTGRENIYLNGAIIGMRKSEIDRKFDDIVEFSEISRFLDTPVKRYSSGMYVRLAFAVASHLEPEILIVDEVLAVGDAQFQLKCLGKMKEVANDGRTIIVVSHNMQYLRSLCRTGIHISKGSVLEIDSIDTVIKNYLSDSNNGFKSDYNLSNIERPKNLGKNLYFNKLSFDKEYYSPGNDLEVSIELDSDGGDYKDLAFGLVIVNEYNFDVLHLSNLFSGDNNISYEKGKVYKFTIPGLNLSPGNYYLRLHLAANGVIQDFLINKVNLVVEEGNLYGYSNSKQIKGIIQPEFSFDIANTKSGNE